MPKKKAKIAKKKSRIPDVYVGDEVNTRIGKKKKVCPATGGMFRFIIGGKWFFRVGIKTGVDLEL
jgi:hypothetical protein